MDAKMHIGHRLREWELMHGTLPTDPHLHRGTINAAEEAHTGAMPPHKG
jgi:hypothetical protein